MGKVNAIIVDIDLCVGCYTCEIACKQENNITIGNGRINVTHIGPEYLGGKLHMDFIPFISNACNLCQHRLDHDILPSCVIHCPTEALKYCKNATEILTALSREKRFHICKLKSEIAAFA